MGALYLTRQQTTWEAIEHQRYQFVTRVSNKKDGNAMEQVIAEKPYNSYSSHFEHNEAHSSGVSWSAVIAGAFVDGCFIAHSSRFGYRLGLSSVSPYSGSGISASTVGKSAIIWLIVMEILSSAMGGYLAGRLRTKWASIHNDEVYFRDTAHGFLAWATAFVITVAFLATAATTMIGSGSTPTNQTEAVKLDPKVSIQMPISSTVSFARMPTNRT